MFKTRGGGLARRAVLLIAAVFVVGLLGGAALANASGSRDTTTSWVTGYPPAAGTPGELVSLSATETPVGLAATMTFYLYDTSCNVVQSQSVGTVLGNGSTSTFPLTNLA